MMLSHLQELLENGTFVVTAEIGPPKGSDSSIITRKASFLHDVADAFNITDNQTAVVRLSSLAGAIIVKKCGLEPIVQFSCRDRNRLALQSEVLGASALGIHNMLFITGDHQSLGNHPQALGVYDIDSIHLVQMVKRMRDEKVFQNGEPIKFTSPQVFIGAVSNPFSTPLHHRIPRLEKKICAGADFIQTQSIFDIDRFCSWMDEIRNRGIDKDIHIIAGVTPLKSVKMMKRMKYHVPGVEIPDDIETRILQAADPKKEGFAIARDLISRIKTISGVHGIHITALFWEDIIPSLVKDTELYPRPKKKDNIR